MDISSASKEGVGCMGHGLSRIMGYVYLDFNVLYLSKYVKWSFNDCLIMLLILQS